METGELFRWVDPIGNIHGRILAANSSADTLLLGSHMVIFDFFFFYSILTIVVFLVVGYSL